MGKDHFVFVYGTLKRSESNHHWLGESNFIKKAETAKKYLLYDLGHYPCMVKAPHGGGKHISGELYQVTDSVLRALDVLESVGYGLYERVRIELLDTVEPVWGYLYLQDVSQFSEAGNSWGGKVRNK